MSAIMRDNQTRLQQAVRENDKAVRTSLRTVVGEVQTRALRPGMSLDDALVIKVLGDTISGNTDILKHRERPDLKAEIALLEGFMPAMMTDADIEAAIVASGATDMPSAMRFLSANHKGLFDGKAAKSIALRLTA